MSFFYLFYFNIFKCDRSARSDWLFKTPDSLKVSNQTFSFRVVWYYTPATENICIFPVENTAFSIYANSLQMTKSSCLILHLIWGSSHPPPRLSLWPVSSCFLSTALNFAPFPASWASSPGSYNGLGVNCLLKDWGLFCAAGWWSPRRVQLSAGVAAVVMQHSCEV